MNDGEVTAHPEGWTAHHDRWIGLMPKWEVVQQLVHVASVHGLTAEDLAEAGSPVWNTLAADALGLQRDGRVVELAVLAGLRELS